MSSLIAEKEVTFKEAISRVAEIIAKLESDECELEEMTSLYKEGMRMISICQKKIESVKLEIENIEAISSEENADQK